MKKVITMLVCILWITMICGCTKKELEKKEIIINDTLEVSFRSLTFGTRIYPSNPHDEFYYWEANQDYKTAIDLQFEITNVSREKVTIEDLINADLMVDGKRLYKEMVLEEAEGTSLDLRSQLNPEERTILHIIFYNEKAISDDGLSIELQLGANEYLVPVKEDYSSKKVKKKFTADDLSLEIKDAYQSVFLFPMNETETSNYYIVEEKGITYFAIFVSITNEAEDPLDLENEINSWFTYQGITTIPSWYSVLNQKEDYFEEETTTIQPNERRTVMFFVQTDEIQKDGKATWTMCYQGKQYRYTFDVEEES